MELETLGNFQDSLPPLVVSAPLDKIESRVTSNYLRKPKDVQISLSVQKDELDKCHSASAEPTDSYGSDSNVSAFSSHSSSCSSSSSDSTKSTRRSNGDDGSTDGYSTKEAIQRLQESINDDEDEEIYIPTTSLPDISLYAKDSVTLRSSLERNPSTTPSRRLRLCPCHYSGHNGEKSEIISELFKRYESILNSPDISPEDRRICERLIMKRGKDLERKMKSRQVKKLMDEDKARRFTENEVLMANWTEQIATKRRWVSEENSRRYLALEEKSKESKNKLIQNLEDRKCRSKRFNETCRKTAFRCLEEVQSKKNTALIERQKREALKQIEVEKAIQKLMEEDRKQKAAIKEKFSRRMENAEQTKRRMEQEYAEKVAEANRTEEIKRTIKLHILEEKSKQSLEELKISLEVREDRARKNYFNQLIQRDQAIAEAAEVKRKALEKAQTVHESLLKGFEEWQGKVLELQKSAQEKAEIKATENAEIKRARVVSENEARDERTLEMLRKVAEEELLRNEKLKASIETKEEKTERLAKEKEKVVEVGRIRARKAAELRAFLKETLDPETFEMKVERVEAAWRVLDGGHKRSSSCNGRRSGDEEVGNRGGRRGSASLG